LFDTDVVALFRLPGPYPPKKEAGGRRVGATYPLTYDVRRSLTHAYKPVLHESNMSYFNPLKLPRSEGHDETGTKTLWGFALAKVSFSRADVKISRCFL
jgi:hypothetical protein